MPWGRFHLLRSRTKPAPGRAKSGKRAIEAAGLCRQPAAAGIREGSAACQPAERVQFRPQAWGPMEDKSTRTSSTPQKAFRATGRMCKVVVLLCCQSLMLTIPHAVAWITIISYFSVGVGSPPLTFLKPNHFGTPQESNKKRISDHLGPLQYSRSVRNRTVVTSKTVTLIPKVPRLSWPSRNQAR